MLDLSVLTSLTKSHERPISWWLTRECYGSGLVKGLYGHCVERRTGRSPRQLVGGFDMNFLSIYSIFPYGLRRLACRW